MKITDVKAIPLYDGEILTRMDCLILIETDDGEVGVGEAYAHSPHGPDAALAIQAIVETGYRPKLLGEDPTDYRRLWERCYRGYATAGLPVHALSGVDIALMDLAGKALKVPAHKLLGGAFRDKVRVYASHMSIRPQMEVALREAREAVEAGYTAIKVTAGLFPGFGLHPQEDGKLLQQVRDVVDDDVELALSFGPGNWVPGWGLSQARRFARELERFDLLFWEEPLPRWDIDGYARLTATVGLPIEAGEGLTDRLQVKDFLLRSGVDVVNTDIVEIGGLSEGKYVAEFARRLGVRVIPHGLGTSVGAAANLQLTASMPDGYLMEYRTSPPSPFMRELLTEPFKFEKGFIHVPNGPGLGIELAEEGVRRYTYTR